MMKTEEFIKWLESLRDKKDKTPQMFWNLVIDELIDIFQRDFAPKEKETQPQPNEDWEKDFEKLPTKGYHKDYIHKESALKLIRTHKEKWEKEAYNRGKIEGAIHTENSIQYVAEQERETAYKQGAKEERERIIKRVLEIIEECDKGFDIFDVGRLEIEVKNLRNSA